MLCVSAFLPSFFLLLFVSFSFSSSSSLFLRPYVFLSLFPKFHLHFFCLCINRDVSSLILAANIGKTGIRSRWNLILTKLHGAYKFRLGLCDLMLLIF